MCPEAQRRTTKKRVLQSALNEASSAASARTLAGIWRSLLERFERPATQSSSAAAARPGRVGHRSPRDVVQFEETDYRHRKKGIKRNQRRWRREGGRNQSVHSDGLRRHGA